MSIPRVTHRFADVHGVRVIYRDAGPEDAPALLLLHGFPSASHQFRRLIDALATRYRVVAPDYPGFGHTQAPPDFTYSFDRLVSRYTAMGGQVGGQGWRFLAASLRQEKVQQGVSYRLDGVEILAVQVEIVEGRQSDQSCRHTAVHADIEATIV